MITDPPPTPARVALALLLFSSLALASPINPVDVAMQEYATRALRLIALVGGVGVVIISALAVMTISWVGLRRLRLIFFGVRVARAFRRDE